MPVGDIANALCEVAVSEYSTLAIEALAFSCRSVALRSDSWTQSIRDAVTQGLIEPADTPADLARARWIARELGDRVATAGLDEIARGSPSSFTERQAWPVAHCLAGLCQVPRLLLDLSVEAA